MRISVKFEPVVSSPSSRPNKHALQGLIYAQLKDTEFSGLHHSKVSKLFTYSDWFKDELGNGHFIISSPVTALIDVLRSRLKEQTGDLTFLDYILKDVEVRSPPNTRLLKTGSPIALVEDKRTNRYHSFRRKSLTLQMFDDLCKQSALRRYRKFSGEEDYDFEGPLFDAYDLRREVAVQMDIRGRQFYVIGSTWNKLFLTRSPSRKKFYSWLMDAGLGEKNSLGFGFLQPYKIGGKKRGR